VELATGIRRQPGSLTMAGISFVFTIARVAEMLDEDQDWLHELSIAMNPEDGCLWVVDTAERTIPAFTEHGVECLQQIIADLRSTGQALPKATP